jgi:hypothetical protein
VWLSGRECACTRVCVCECAYRLPVFGKVWMRVTFCGTVLVCGRVGGVGRSREGWGYACAHKSYSRHACCMDLDFVSFKVGVFIIAHPRTSCLVCCSNLCQRSDRYFFPLVSILLYYRHEDPHTQTQKRRVHSFASRTLLCEMPYLIFHLTICADPFVLKSGAYHSSRVLSPHDLSCSLTPLILKQALADDLSCSLTPLSSKHRRLLII